MTEKQYIQPEGIFDGSALGFTQVVTSPPGTLVFVSGQVPWDINRQLVGDTDLAAQTEQVLKNLDLALKGAGASVSDVTMIHVFFVDYKPDYAAIVIPILNKFFGGKPPASTWLGVQTLANPHLRIEIEAIAVVGRDS
ncbi:RidA family protein [Nostoc sp. CENA67]|uniref:RidA family protein n=1 Tax=Amazonocrinis nigriterrae CENA67 TaxID=2794033 RepID=A0A8J7L7P9_9NOST|nr:RidA family protein [Amazonocrinis nigriterrae]MBH8563644.1 RidA family protein [Amazonocrinis nigriterrae CENA67]